MYFPWKLTVPLSDRPKRITLQLFTILLVLCFGLPSLALSQSTVFLPLKINAGSNKTALSHNSDTVFTEILGEHEITFLPRNQAETVADYRGNWPPPAATLQEIATNLDADNVAAGSMTVIGDLISIDLKVFDALNPTKPQYFFKSGNSLAELSTVVNSLILDVQAYTGREFRIATIAPSGNKRIDSGAILRKIKSRAGGPYDQSTLRNDLKAIYSMGYFNDVQIDVKESKKGKNITFHVIEKPTIAAVTFTGLDELSEEDVRGAANIQEHFILNPKKVSEGVEAIQELYKSKGYYNTQVTSDISFPSDEGAIVHYEVVEGKKIYIKEITIEGNKAFDDDELIDEIETGEKGFFSWLTASGLLEMDKIKQDSGRIAAYYHDNGYLEAKISDPIITQKEEWLHVTFQVEEGARFTVGTVDVDGDLITDKEDLLKLVTIVDEEYMNRSIIREDVMSITDFYAEKGYAFASVRPNMQKSTIGDGLDVTFRVNKGELVYVNRIHIKGNDRTRDNVIRRELRIAEGGVFDAKALRQSSQALQRLMFFEEVNITPEPTMDPTRMNINIEVKERSTGTFSIGAGYSSADDMILTGSISENNFLGRGEKLELSANIGGSSSRYNLSYTNPHYRDSELSLGGDLFNSERDYDDYERESVGGSVRVGYPVWEKWKLFGTYSFTDTDLSWEDNDDPSNYIVESAKINIMSAVKLAMIRDTRNKMYGATKGSRHMLSVKYAGGPFGGDAQFTKFEASTSWYFPLFWKTVFHFKGAAGQAIANETGKLPIYEKFFLGGISTVRGFEYGDISPEDPDPNNDDKIGGKKMWYSNLEFIFPLLEEQGIQGLVFYDMGQVLDNDEDWNIDDFETAAGVGIRWLSPMGPLSIVWGMNLDPDEDEDDSVFDFSLGGTF